MTRLGILLSGRGSNFLAIAAAIREERLPAAEIAVVLSNRAGAEGLAAARELGIPALPVPAEGRTAAARDMEFVDRLREFGVHLVCLAGYMRMISPAFVRAFPRQILNIHPSLLPSFPGLEAQRQALDAGVKVSGCTAHFVDELLDHGVIVLQRAVPVHDGDTVESLSARILAEEHTAYPEAIARVIGGTYEVRGKRYVQRATHL